MILILADNTDPWATLVHREISKRGEATVWIQPAELLDRVQLNWPVMEGSPLKSGALFIDGHRHALADITGMYVHPALPLPLPLDELAPQDRDYVVKETSATWLALLQAMPCWVVNRPVPGGRPALLAGSPSLSRLARDHGFALPPSRVTSSQADAILQFAAWSERVYLKPLGSPEPGIVLRSRDGVEQICGMMEGRAVSLQSIPSGQRVTVYVIGDEAAATILQADDPQAGSAGVATLPTDDCVGLVQALGLAFAECQIIVTSEGSKYCLDVSGSPSYWRCPQEGQRKIVNRLADYLSKSRSLALHDSLDGADGGPGAGQCLCQTGGPER